MRGAFDVAGALPGAELVRVARIFVVQDGVEVVDLFHAVLDEPAHGGGAGHAGLVAALNVVLRGIYGVAVFLQVRDEIGGKFVRHELGHERGLGGLGGGIVRRVGGKLAKNGVGGGEQVVVAAAGGRGGLVGEAGRVLSSARAVRVMFCTSSRRASSKTVLLVVPPPCWAALALSRAV